MPNEPADAQTGEVFGEITQREAIALVAVYADKRDGAKEAVDQKDIVGNQLKGWLTRHPGEELEDRERGLTAVLQTKPSAPTYDVRSMPVSLLFDLQAAGLLTVNATALRQLLGKQSFADEAEKYAYRGQTTALIIKEKRR